MANLQISPDFFKMEIRDGFPIGEIMKRNWAAQMQVLVDIGEMCAKHNIRWFAYAGTLLGAVRHKGFIPWDDDIDICMPGEDYIKFLYYATDDLKDRYMQLSPYSNGEWEQRAITRLVNATNMTFVSERMDNWHNCPFAIGTDIFPFYYVPRDKDKEEFILSLLKKVTALYDVSDYQVKLLKDGRREEANGLNDLITASIIGLQEDTGFEFTGDKKLTNQLSMLYDQICRFTTDDEADYLTIYPFYEGNRNFKMPKEKFNSSCMLPFEMIELPSISDYDYFCRLMYGKNYMTPRRGGAAHEYPYFGRDIRKLENALEKMDLVERLNVSGSLSFAFPSAKPFEKEKKCKVLYYTGVREMMIYGEYVIDKIRDVIRYFKENSDEMTLKWCPGLFYSPDKETIDYDRLVPELKEKYMNLIAEYRDLGIGELDESGDPEKQIDGCDLYYGDESLLSDYFSHTGRPVYIQDYHTRFTEDTVGCTPIKESGIFSNDLHPIFDDAVYLEDGKGYAFAQNMNGFFKIDIEKKTCKFMKLFPTEDPDGQYLYTGIKKINDKLLLIPGFAKHAMLFDPVNNTYRPYDVSTDTLSKWHDFSKYASCIEYDGKWYFVGERYTHILKVDPETGKKEMIDTGSEKTVWMRHGAFREGGLVKIVSSNSSEMLTFNLRTEKCMLKKKYNLNEILPKMQQLANEAHSLKEVELSVDGSKDAYIDEAFKSYNKENSMIIKENVDMFSFQEVIQYIEWKKAER